MGNNFQRFIENLPATRKRTNIYDASDNHYPLGLEAGVTQVSGGPFGKALDFTADTYSRIEVLDNGLDWDWGTGLYTVECFVKWPSMPPSHTVLMGTAGWGVWTPAPNGAWLIGWDASNDGRYSFAYQLGGFGWLLTLSGHVPIITGEWIHLAVVCTLAGDTYKFFINGEIPPSWPGTSSAVKTGYNQGILSYKPLNIGTDAETSYGNNDFYLAEVRFSKGVARYTENFTVPTAPFTPDANTVLLIH